VTFFSPLQKWLDRREPLSGFIDLENRQPNQEYGAFLGLDKYVPLHESVNVNAQSFKETWHSTEAYVTKSLNLIDADEPLWLDSEEARLILNTLGSPPPYCYPIYLITVGTGAKERVVYIGKTSSSHPRFTRGHAAVTKLHNPKYGKLRKRLYMGCVVLLEPLARGSLDKEYLPLEWIHPFDSAKRLLSDIEAQLIYKFQPELNSQHKQHYNATFSTTIHIQNFTGRSKFLHDQVVYP
jgi:hypothetical protein